MATYTVYRLTFRKQLHLGRSTGAAQEGSLGLEKTACYIPADVLFSAICEMWRQFYDAESLTDFLKEYTQEAAELPFMLTSAFPFAGDVYFFPKPLTFTHLSKESKSVAFVSQTHFENIISGTPLKFDKNDLITGGKIWISRQEKARLKTKNKDEMRVWETATRPRVTIGGQSAGSEIWHVESVTFNTDCGLWFIVRFDSETTQQKIETLLRVLGDSGIGGERNAGYGVFEITQKRVDFEMSTPAAGDAFVTLSPICPKSPNQLEHLLSGDNIAYDLHTSTGWVNRAGNAASRKAVNRFVEGSVLHTNEPQIGCFVDLTPDDWAHPVYRYGYAWQVGIKGASA